MLDPAGTIKQIAESLGFQHPQHFLRFFKRQVGCTPKEYRTQNIGIS
jgi:AraC-like DNA-binding protein